MTIGSICIREVQLAVREESVAAVARRMRRNNVGTVVVLDPERRPQGIITDRDIALRVVADELDPKTTIAFEVMTDAPRCLPESTPIEEALSLMRSGRFRRVPVVDKKGALVGIIAMDDILELLCEEFETIGGLLRREAPRREPPVGSSAAPSRP